MRIIKITFLLVSSLLLFTACQTAPKPESAQPTTRTRDIRQGSFVLPGSNEASLLTYEVIDGYAIWQGDIILGKVDKTGDLESQGVAIQGFSKRWPNAVIPFVISGTWPDDPATPVNENTLMRDRITTAIGRWQAQTPIRFVARTTQSDYVEFKPAENTCSSRVGRTGGAQPINLATGCGVPAVIHEIGHAVGLFHEHQRTDRDSHVRIIEANIDNGDLLNPFDDKVHNFNIPFDAFNINTYDFRSIMHYPCNAFSNGNGNTIEPINPPAGVTCNQIGNFTDLSAGDIAAVNALYPPLSLAWSQNTTGIGDSSELNDHMGKVLTTGDFNNDGRDDLAIGIPDESVGSLGGAGIVQVFYGSATGVFNTSTDQVWHQDVSGVQGAAETNDHFGAALAAGDFNNDGFDDLAIGIPDENTPSSVSNSGAIIVLYGTPTGLSATNNQFWSQNASGIADTSESGDRFGAALAVGDFNGNGFDDLAIGVPGEDIENPFPFPADFDAGSVHVIYGSSSRLGSSGSQRWTQDSSGILDETEGGDQFGFSLASGDFNNDNRDDLAIGIPFEDFGTAVLDNDSGAVAVLYGSTTGVSSTDQFWTQDSSGISDDTEGGDNFGFSVTAGDFNNDGRDDLAIGVPSEDIGIDIDTGLVHVIYGASGALSSTSSQIWTQDSSGIPDSTEIGDRFGHALATGDFNNSGHDDLAIGVPNEDIGLVLDAGAVHIIFGSNNRLVSSGNLFRHQDSLGLNNANPETVAEIGDNFGAALAAGDFNGNGRDDLAIGVPGEAIGLTLGAGMVNVLVF